MTADLHFACDTPLTRAGAAIDLRARQLAGGLAALGVDDGDVVAVLLRNHPAYVDVIRACRIAGCFYCPINWHFKPDEVLHLLRDSQARVLVVQADLLPALVGLISAGLQVLVVDADGADRLPAGAHPYDAWLATQPPYAGPPRQPRGHMAYTSGTTGRPKGVKRHAVPADQLEAQTAALREVVAAAFGIVPGVRALVSAPLYHSAPSLFMQQALDQGALAVLAPRFDAEQTLALIEQHRIETVYLVPIMFVRLLRLPAEVRRRYDLRSLRFVACTGAPCAPEVKRAMLDWLGPVVYETYASSETGMLTVQDPASARRKPASAGKPIAGARIRIVAEDGHACAPGEQGVIYGRQPAFADFSYQNQPHARAAIERDGLVTLGDVGYLDEDGYLFICDRACDMVISGGVNIYPAEIEHALMSLPGVADCAVFGIPDEEYGESLAAVIEARDEGLDAERVRRHLEPLIAGYKLPRRIDFVARLPRDDNGKVAKRRLRDAWWAQRERRV
ncbi:MAG TPA: AMP-binding protein [Albitalea sp.]|uniref:AMP-binding protein n=1 Tax=Piscinibacter sp. TaxID=1903157 RepID=UPI002ED4BDD7